MDPDQNQFKALEQAHSDDVLLSVAGCDIDEYPDCRSECQISEYKIISISNLWIEKQSDPSRAPE
jgi:7-cyano-7-deazaguanine synthase in queuosine biosynthesis